MDNLIEQQRKHFNTISAKYTQARKDPNHLLLKDLIWNKFLKRNSNLTTEIKWVLEPMCGIGEGHEIISKHLTSKFDYQGFDYSEDMVRIAQSQKPALEIKCKDVTTYQSTTKLFDLIILLSGLHHVYPHTQYILENLRKSLRAGGYFLSFEPTHDNWLTKRIRQRIYNSNNLFDADSEQGFGYKELNQYFKNAGYEKVDAVYPGLLAYILFFNPDAFPLLNIGRQFWVRGIFAIDRLFWTNVIGRKLSFATISLWKRA